MNWLAAPWAEALAWTLIHFLWEGAAIALALAAALFFVRPGSARLRYWLGAMALLAMPVAFAVTLAVLLPEYSVRVTRYAGSVSYSVPGALGSGQFVGFTGGSNSLDWLVPVWMAGVLVFYLRSLGGWIAARRFRTAGNCAAALEWQDRFQRLCRLVRVSRPVQLLESSLAEAPVVIGMLRPVVLVPVGVLTGLRPEQVEAILIHELAHVRRHDYLVNLLQSVVEGLLFYHPAVWWISRLVRTEREHCCDDVVIELSGDARGYAAALAILEQNRRPACEPALAANGGNLVKRIRRMLQVPEAPRYAATPLILSGALIVLAAAGLAAWQMAPAAPASPAQTPVAPPAAATSSEFGARLLRLRRPFQRIPNRLGRLLMTTSAQDAQTPYEKWLREDVAYIITDAERAAFKRLQTDEEREHFIEQFWLRRDPTPGTVQNEFKEEHYRRIAYANEHFASYVPGWKTDRGRVYIIYGPPDEIESHPAGVMYDAWSYRNIEGFGPSRMLFDGQDGYRLAASNALPAQVPAYLVTGSFSGTGGATVQTLRGGLAAISIPLSGPGSHRVYGRLGQDGKPVTMFEDLAQGPEYRRILLTRQGNYRLNLITKSVDTNAVAAGEVNFEVH